MVMLKPRFQYNLSDSPNLHFVEDKYSSHLVQIYVIQDRYII